LGSRWGIRKELVLSSKRKKKEKQTNPVRPHRPSPFLKERQQEEEAERIQNERQPNKKLSEIEATEEKTVPVPRQNAVSANDGHDDQKTVLKRAA